jgi:hypothetical protein
MGVKLGASNEMKAIKLKCVSETEDKTGLKWTLE